jgi:hypothetical protein
MNSRGCCPRAVELAAKGRKMPYIFLGGKLMRGIAVLCVGLALLLCVSATAAAPKPIEPAKEAPPAIDEGGKVDNPPERLQISYKFVDGQANRYQVQIMNRGSYRLLNSKKEQKLDTVTELFFRQTIKAAEDGLYKIQWALLSGVVRIPDFGESSITLPDLVYTMDDRGAVKKVTGLEKLALLPGKPQQKSLATIFGQMSFQGFPKTAVKIGDEWTRDYSVTVNETDKITAKAKSKLVGYEKCDGYDCAKIETKYDYPVKYEIADKINGKLKLEGKESGVINTRFAYGVGKMIRSEADIKTDAKVTKADGSGDAFVKLNLNAVSRLLPAKADTKEGG